MTSGAAKEALLLVLFVLTLIQIYWSPASATTHQNLPVCPTGSIPNNCLGSATWGQGHIFIGAFKEGFPHAGKLTMSNGDIYLGVFKDGRFHGRGTYKFANGNKFIGDFKEGLATGRGTLYFSSGNTYSGEVQDSRANGRGEFRYADGSAYVGEWIDDKRHGEGIEYRSSGVINRSGRWIANELIHEFELDPKKFQLSQSASSQPEVSTDPSAAEAEQERLKLGEARRIQEERARSAEAEARERKRMLAQAAEEQRQKAALAAQQNESSRREKQRERAASGGTAFLVAPGLVVTNHHVVSGCEKVDVFSDDGRRSGVILKSDESVDLALVRVSGLTGSTATIRRSGSVRLGESAYSFGFPLAGLLSTGGNFTSGVVSSLRGPRDSANLFQITTPVQQGSSGGALLDSSGTVIGVIVSKLDAVALARVTGDLPQNVNFAISITVLRDFLTREKVQFRSAERGSSTDGSQLATLASGISHRLVCTN